jgi:hypothetical protein
MPLVTRHARLAKVAMPGLTFHSELDQLGFWMSKFTAVKKAQIDIGNRGLSCDRSDGNRRQDETSPTAAASERDRRPARVNLLLTQNFLPDFSNRSLMALIGCFVHKKRQFGFCKK